MVGKLDSSHIILTYKGKVLLRLNDNNPHVYDFPLNREKSTWGLINTSKVKGKSFEEAIIDKVKTETGLKLNNVEFLSTRPFNDKTKHFFQARLSDDHVNSIVRDNGITLQFFTLKEVLKLNLTALTREFMEEYSPVNETSQIS